MDLEADNHAYLHKAWMAVGGVYLFFIADRLIKIIAELKKQKDFRRLKQMSTILSVQNPPILSIAVDENDQGFLFLFFSKFSDFFF